MAGTISKINVNGTTYNIGGSGGGTVTNITYSELVSLKDAGNLIPEAKYRITDYVTSFKDWQSGNHQFDIIVTASANNSLYSEAQAALHEGDDYFANSKLDSWRIWYDITNDTKIYPQANSSGKGSILRMIDEFNNDANYDFKNAMFEVTTDLHSSLPNSLYFYSFSYFAKSINQLTQDDIYDMSIRQDCTVKENVIKLLLNDFDKFVTGGKKGLFASLNAKVHYNKYEYVSKILLLSEGFGGENIFNDIQGDFVVNNPVTISKTRNIGNTYVNIPYTTAGINISSCNINNGGSGQLLIKFSKIGSNVNIYVTKIKSYSSRTSKIIFDNQFSNAKCSSLIINELTSDLHVSETEINNSILSAKGNSYKITDLSV